MIKTFLVTTCLLCSILLAESRPPNIVFFFIDDMGYGDIGPTGSTKNKTPHLDNMAKEGIVFTDFYVSNTACTPSRSALMTGSYASRIGMDGRVVFPGDKRGLNPEEITIAEVLKTKGYVTGCFGKWHLGDQPEFLPLAQGFDEYEGIPYSNDMWPHLAKHKLPLLPYVKGNKVVAQIPDGKNQALLCDTVTAAAVDFIKRNAKKPFFAYIPHSYIHLPRFVLKERADRANGDITRAQIEEVDGSVGKVIAAIKELGIEKNTLVIFTSDNGGSGGTSMGPLRGNKGGPKYEGHMRVRMVAWWPSKIPAGSITKEIGATIDMLPTFAKLAGAEVPKDRVIDGMDISDVLLAKPDAKSPHEVLYYEIQGVRKGKWKLVKNRKPELYNLEDDIGEKKNIAKDNPEILKELTTLLTEHTKRLQKDCRKAAFVKEGKPLLGKTAEGVPTLAEYIGKKDFEVSGNYKNKKKGKPSPKK